MTTDYIFITQSWIVCERLLVVVSAKYIFITQWLLNMV